MNFIIRALGALCGKSRMVSACGITLFAGLWASGPLCAQTPVPAGEALVKAGLVSDYTATHTAEGAGKYRISAVAVDGPGFTRATRIETTQEVPLSYAIEARTPTTRAVAKGDVVMLRLFVRTLMTTDETGMGQFRVVVQKASGDHEQSLERQPTVGSAWQEFLMPFAFGSNFAAGAAEISFGFGFKKQTIEIGGLEVIYYGSSKKVAELPATKLSYVGREPDAQWRKDALARIEQIRKGDFQLQVVDEAGAPVPSSKVHVEMIRSDFEFGTAIQPQRLLNQTPDNIIYQQKLLELFNSGTLENHLKWHAWAGESEPMFKRADAMAGLRWLKDHGLAIRGHVLVWPGKHNLPKLVKNLLGTPQEATIPQLVRDHIVEELQATKGLLVDWDCVNEPFTNHDLIDLFGEDFLVDCFKTAHQASPDTPMFLNDFSNHDRSTDLGHVESFDKTARSLLAKGAPLAGLGLQAHIGSTPNALVNVLAVLDGYATMKLPIRITEFDIKTTDEQLQADYTRDFMILCFSHPSIIGFQFWGFWDRAHWIANAGMFRADWSERPSVQVYRSLVLDQWRTRIDGSTDKSGEFSGRGFYGDYNVTIEVGGAQYKKTFSLKKGATKTEVKLELPKALAPAK